MWRQVNPNPCGRYVGDCVIRAISIILDQTWEKTYVELCIVGFLECDIPSANHVWGKYLEEKGFQCSTIPEGWNTIKAFADTHPEGDYILATGSHIVAVMDGDYYDAWDSGYEIAKDIWEEK